MSYNTELQNNNITLQAILDGINALPTPEELLADVVKHSEQSLTEVQKAQARENIGIQEIQQFTSLPSSGTTLTANAEYRVSSAVSTYQFKLPANGDVYVRFTTGSTFTISFASGTTYLGAAPDFEASTTYELMARDGVVAVAAVVSA